MRNKIVLEYIEDNKTKIITFEHLENKNEFERIWNEWFN